MLRNVKILSKLVQIDFGAPLVELDTDVLKVANYINLQVTNYINLETANDINHL